MKVDPEHKDENVRGKIIDQSAIIPPHMRPGHASPDQEQALKARIANQAIAALRGLDGPEFV